MCRYPQLKSTPNLKSVSFMHLHIDVYSVNCTNICKCVLCKQKGCDVLNLCVWNDTMVRMASSIHRKPSQCPKQQATNWQKSCHYFYFIKVFLIWKSKIYMSHIGGNLPWRLFIAFSFHIRQYEIIFYAKPSRI